MLSGHFHMFAFLVKLIILLNAQQRINCKVLAIDTCAKEDWVYFIPRVERIDIPMQAGKEGTNLESGEISLHTDLKVQDSWSIKFYVKVGRPPQTGNSMFFLLDAQKVALKHMANGSFLFNVRMIPNSASISIAVDNPKEDFISKSLKDDSFDSDWIQLGGIKMKVSNKEKPKTSFEDWKLIGIEYSKYSLKEGYIRLYINGRLSVDSTIHKALHHNSLFVRRGQFSCIQYHGRKMGEAYYKDPNLNECKQRYEGESKEKFEKCHEGLDKKPWYMMMY